MNTPILHPQRKTNVSSGIEMFMFIPLFSLLSLINNSDDSIKKHIRVKAHGPIG